MKWTEEEDAVLFAHYARLGAKGVVSMLPGRTPKAIHRRAYLLGVGFDEYVHLVHKRPEAELACDMALRNFRCVEPENEPLMWRVA
jgi:hypothetical protein